MRFKSFVGFACLLLAQSVFAQTTLPSVTATAKAGSSASSSLSFSITIPADSNRYLVCGGATQDTSKTLTSVTANGTNLTFKNAVDNGASLQARTEYWDLVAPASGSVSIVMTWNGSTAVAGGCVSVKDVNQTTPIGSFTTALNNSNTASVNVSSNTSELVIDVASIRVGTTGITEGSGQTNQVEQQSAAGAGNVTIGMSTKTGSTTTTMSWTVDDSTNKAWATQGVSIKGVTSGGGGGGTGGYTCSRKTYAGGTSAAGDTTYTNSQLQNMLDDGLPGETLCYQNGIVYSGEFVLGPRSCPTNTLAACLITIRSGIDSTGAIAGTFPGAGIRVLPGVNTASFATLRSNANNAPALRTSYPGETGSHGCSATPCVANYWKVDQTKFEGFAPWHAGAMLIFGTNQAASDVPSGNVQDVGTEIPHDLYADHVWVAGDPIHGHHRGINISADIVTVENSHIGDIFSFVETQGILIINNRGPVTIRNNYIEGSGESFFTGGGDPYGQFSATVLASPAPTTTSYRLSSCGELEVKQWHNLVISGTKTYRKSTALNTSTCDVTLAAADALPSAPAAGTVVNWAWILAGLTVEYNRITKNLAWMNPLVPTPTNVSGTVSATGGTCPAATVNYRVEAVITGTNGVNDMYSAASPNLSKTFTGSTGSIPLTWTAVANADYYLVYRDNTRYQTSTNSFTDTCAAGTTASPRNTGMVVTVKNTLELKNCDGRLSRGRCIIRYNHIERSWKGAQTGMVINLKSNQQGGLDHSAVLSGVTVEYNKINSGSRVLQLCATNCQPPFMSGTSEDIIFRHNQADDIGDQWLEYQSSLALSAGSAAGAMPNVGGTGIVFDHLTILQKTTDYGPMLGDVGTGNQWPGFQIKNSIFRRGANGFHALWNGSFGAGGEGTTAFNNICPSGTGCLATKNVWADATCTAYPDTPNNFCPAEATLQTNFLDYANANYELASSSAWNNAGTDGLDLGADIVAIRNAMVIADSGNNSGGGGGSPLTITTLSIPSGIVGTTYSQQIVATGGTAPYTFTRISGAQIPPGITLSSGGLISGTPTTTGSATFTVRVTDAASATDDQVLTLQRLAARPVRVNADERFIYADCTEPSLNNGRIVIQGDLWVDTCTNVIRWRKTDAAWEQIGVAGPATAVKLDTNGTQPTCDASQQGVLWIVSGVPGTSKDTVSVCAKDIAGAYAWRTLY